MSAQPCPNCDAPLPENARFCSNCGQTVAQTSATVNLVAPPTAPAPLATAPQNQSLAAPPQPQPIYAPQPAPGQQPAYGPPQQINVVVNASTHTSMAAPQTVVLVQQKSVGLAFLLTFLFGPFGLFYVSVGGAIAFILISIVLSLVTFGAFAFIAWIISMVWGVVAASNYNKQLIVR